MSNEELPGKSTLPSTNASCFRAVGITCLTFLIISLLSLGFMVYMVAKMPSFTKQAQCKIHLEAVGGALSRYAERNGSYPAKLADLYPDFLDDKSMLHCPADKSRAEISYQYTPPKSDAPDDTVMIVCRRHTLPSPWPSTMMLLRKNGQVDLLPAVEEKPHKNPLPTPKPTAIQEKGHPSPH